MEMVNKSVFFSLLFFGQILLAQTQKQDLSNDCDCQDGRFHMEINKGKLELIPGIYRSRMGRFSNGFGLNNQNLTLNIYFPFTHLLRKDGREENLMQMNVVSFIHFSDEGNYGVGFGSKTRWLIKNNWYLSYQGGIGWFDTNNSLANDGLNTRGFNFHHIFSIIRPINKKWDASLNFIHVSNGGIVGKNENSNVQDVMGVGVSYQF